jgi:hypothetical protein
MVGTLLRYGYLKTRGEALRVEDVRSAWGRVLRVICKDGSWLKMRYSTFERSEYELALFDTNRRLLLFAVADTELLADCIGVEADEQRTEHCLDVAYLLLLMVRYGWYRRVVLAWDGEGYRLVRKEHEHRYDATVAVGLRGVNDDEEDETY